MSCSCASRRGLAVVAAAFVLVLSPAAGAASAEDRAVAKQHAARAEQLKKQGQLAEACKELEQVERLDPKLPTSLELAECTEQQGKLVEAEGFWAAARDRAKRDEKPQSRARAEARLAAVQKRIARLTLQLAPGTPPGAQVLRDDVAVEPGALGTAQPTNPGEHVIVVRLAGHDDAKYPVKLADGDQQTLAVAVGPAAGSRPAAATPAPAPAAPASAPLSTAPAVVAAPAESTPPVSTSWWTEQRTAGVIFGAAGVVALGAGTALCLGAKGDVSDRKLTLGAISLASGGVLFLSGIVLLASALSADSSTQARLKVAPTLLLARDGTVVGAAGTF